MSSDAHNQTIWTSAPWLELATSWLDEQLAKSGMKRTGGVTQPHLRPWSTVLTAPTTHGPVWLKATGPATAFEAGLNELLGLVVPTHVLVPIAVDIAGGWVLLPNGGPPLGDRLSGAALTDALATILRDYARLQRDFASNVDTALELGVTDMRSHIMPRRFDEAVEAVGRSVSARGDARDHDTLRKVSELRETFESWCERLDASPGTASLDHNDLHPWNMLVPRLDRPGEVKFYDWGDAVVAHPFASMLVALNSAQHRLATSFDGPDLVRIRDTYLEVFGDLAPHTELVETLEVACRVGKVARALTWSRSVAQIESGNLDNRYASAPMACLRSLLDESYLGGA